MGATLDLELQLGNQTGGKAPCVSLCYGLLPPNGRYVGLFLAHNDRSTPRIDRSLGTTRRGGFFVFDPFALLRANAKNPQKNRYFSRAKVLILLYYYDIIF